MTTTIDEVKHDRNALKAALEAAGVTKWSGTACACPFCDDTHPSAGIYSKGNGERFKCHKCGFEGDIYDVRAKVAGRPVKELMSEARRAAQSLTPPMPQTPSSNDIVKADPDEIRRAQAAWVARQKPSPPPAYVPPSLTIDALSASLGVSVEALEAQGTHRGEGCWRTPERDAEGNVIGHALRLDIAKFVDGKWTSKISEAGGKRGLTTQWPLSEFAGASIDDPIIIIEGGSDQAAAHDLGMVGIGRPSATGGGDLLRIVCKARHVCIVGENDKAGRDGAEKIADGLRPVAESVKVIYPPAEVKDLRAWKAAGLTGDDLRRLIDSTQQGAPKQKDKDEKADDLIARCAADVNTRPVSWFWRNKFVAGAINLLIGMPDVGKSVVTCDLAARTTTGESWPPVDGERAENSVGSVLFFAAEDSPETTLVPRLRAAGADLSKVHFIEGVNRETSEGKVRDQFDIQRDVMHLRELHKRILDLGLVIIDPLDSYISAKTDTNVGNQARAALWPLKDWAEETGITVIIVHHFNKSATTNAMDKVSGARSFGALPRSVWAVGRDPEDERRTILAPIKLNLVKQEAKKAIAYEIKSSLADPDQPCVHWMDENVNVTAGDIVAGKQTQKCKAAEWLRDMLANGPMPAKELKEHAEEAGMPWRTVEKAKDEAGVVSEQRYEGKRIVGWEWRLK